MQDLIAPSPSGRGLGRGDQLLPPNNFTVYSTTPPAKKAWELLIADQISHCHSLSRWFASALGGFVTQEISKEVQLIPQLPSGQNLLQLGFYAGNAWLDHLDFQNRWIASPFALTNPKVVQCSLEQLPFTRNSLDCVVVPLTLELFSQHFGLIDEIDRVLKPMGHVIFICLNPWSAWGLAVHCGLLNGYSKAIVHMHTPSHLHRVFAQRGYRQCFLGNFCYIPPVNKASLLAKLTFLDEMGKMLWPLPSGLYCYVAQKYEYIAPDVAVKDRKLAPEFLEPAASGWHRS